MLKRRPYVQVWQKDSIRPGAEWMQTIFQYINHAHMILFPVSPDFLASEQCYREMVEAIKRKDEPGITIIPLLLRPVAGWEDTPIGGIKPLPDDKKFLTQHLDRQRALQNIVEQLTDFVNKWHAAHPSTSEPLIIQSNASPGSEYASISSASASQDKVHRQEFDVFLCYHAQDRPAVKHIAKQLKQHGILPWLDEWELQPGLPWQDALERQIKHIQSAAVFVGQNGIGPWQRQELRALIREFVKRECPVIPVLLPDAPGKPDLPLFLDGMTWVDFSLQDPDPLQQLIKGIAGKSTA